MPKNIEWPVSSQIPEGPTFNVNRSLSVDAYDLISVVIPAKGTAATSKDVRVVPSAQGSVKFLLVTSSVYDSKAPVTYTPKGGSKPEVKLDAPQLRVGTSIDTLLGGAFDTLTFKNSLPNDVSITILVGRDVA